MSTKRIITILSLIVLLLFMGDFYFEKSKSYTNQELGLNNEIAINRGLYLNQQELGIYPSRIKPITIDKEYKIKNKAKYKLVNSDYNDGVNLYINDQHYYLSPSQNKSDVNNVLIINLNQEDIIKVDKSITLIEVEDE